jgi:protein NrfD
MHETTSTRANPLIDPSLHVWGPEVALYLFLGGLVAGIMVLVAWRALRHADVPRSRALALAPWSVPVLLSAGMLFLWLDLANRFNAFRFYLILRPQSPMSWGAWILVAIYPVSIAFAWAASPAAMQLRWQQRGGRLARLGEWATSHFHGVAQAQAVLGILLGIYTGILLGAFAARPLWNSAVLGPLFLVSGLSSGAAFLLLLRLAAGERRTFVRADMALIFFEVVLLALWFLTLAAGGAGAQAAVRLLFGGDFTAAFWTLVVALGLVTPLVAEWIEARHGVLPGRAAAVLVLLGGLALRWIVVDAGQSAADIARLAMH